MSISARWDPTRHCFFVLIVSQEPTRPNGQRSSDKQIAMAIKKELGGVVPIVPTPFTANEEVDETALRNLVEFAVSSKLQAVCLPAYASEFYKLSDEEKLQVVKLF